MPRLQSDDKFQGVPVSVLIQVIDTKVW